MCCIRVEAPPERIPWPILSGVSTTYNHIVHVAQNNNNRTHTLHNNIRPRGGHPNGARRTTQKRVWEIIINDDCIHAQCPTRPALQKLAQSVSACDKMLRLLRCSVSDRMPGPSLPQHKTFPLTHVHKQSYTATSHPIHFAVAVVSDSPSIPRRNWNEEDIFKTLKIN